MYYRVYQINNAIYPGWGYNLTIHELNEMANWWLSSLYDSEAIGEQQFNEMQNALKNTSEESLIIEIQKLGEFDGGLEVEKSKIPFDQSELGPGEEIERPWN